jgi:hypothetical protein
VNWLRRRLYALYCRLSPRKRRERELARQVVESVTLGWDDPKLAEVRDLFLKILE